MPAICQDIYLDKVGFVAKIGVNDIFCYTPAKGGVKKRTSAPGACLFLEQNLKPRFLLPRGIQRIEGTGSVDHGNSSTRPTCMCAPDPVHVLN